MKVHMKKKHESKNMFECEKCPSEFKYEKNLTRHVLEKHVSKETELKCPDCEKVFSQKRYMERHQMSHKKSS